MVYLLITSSTDRFQTTMDNSARSSDELTLLLFGTAAVAKRVLLGPVPLVPAHLIGPVLGSATRTAALSLHVLTKKLEHKLSISLISIEKYADKLDAKMHVSQYTAITSMQAPFQPSQWTRKPPSRHPASWGRTWWGSPAVLQPETSVSGPFLRIREARSVHG